MTENKNTRNEIIKHFEIHLKPEGFRKKGNSLIRETEAGLIQLIDFVFGQNLSITKYHIGLGFGIYTEEWFNHLIPNSKPQKLNQSSCELRSDFNEFIPKDNNFGWIDLNQKLTLVYSQIQSLIDTHFISQLNNLTTREKIIEQWEQNGNAIGLPPRGRLSIAILYWYLNKKELANNLIDSELFENQGKPYVDFVIKTRNDLNKNAP